MNSECFTSFIQQKSIECNYIVFILGIAIQSFDETWYSWI